MDGRRRDVARECAPSLVDDACVEHLQCTLLDACKEDVTGNLEPEDQRLMPDLIRPQAVRLRVQRRPELRQLECANDAAAVVGVDVRRRLRVALRQDVMRTLRAEPVVELLPPGAQVGGRRRRQPKLDERRA